MLHNKHLLYLCLFTLALLTTHAKPVTIHNCTEHAITLTTDGNNTYTLAAHTSLTDDPATHASTTTNTNALTNSHTLELHVKKETVNLRELSSNIGTDTVINVTDEQDCCSSCLYFLSGRKLMGITVSVHDNIFPTKKYL